MVANHFFHSMPSPSPLAKLLHHVWDHSSFYRDYYHAHGIRENNLDEVSLSDLPILTKQLLFEHFDEIVTDPRIRRDELDRWMEIDHNPRRRYLDQYLVIHTSGSSGKMASIAYTESCWQKMSAEASAYLFPQQLSNHTKYRTAYFIGERNHIASATTAMNSTSAQIDHLIVSLEDALEENIARLNSYQPDRLTSYASWLDWLADLTLSGKLRISPRDVVTSSDKMTPDTQDKISRAWNANLYNLYAATEALFIAIKPPTQPEWKILEGQQEVEVLTPENRPAQSGEVGRGILTHWHNWLTPLIRYDLTDYLICGETQPGKKSLRGILCRTYEDLPILGADGTSAYIPAYELAGVKLPGLDTLQFISIAPDQFQIEYTASQTIDAALSDRIQVLLKKWGGARSQFTTRRVERIWNDAATLKVKMVRSIQDHPIDLSEQISTASLRPPQPASLRPGQGFQYFPLSQLEEIISAIFERHVAAQPNALAVQAGDHSLTYGQLNSAANGIAQAIQSRLFETAQPVALLFDHSPDMIVAILGVLKAGACYLPLNPDHPPARNQAILRALGGAPLLLTHQKTPAKAAVLASAYDLKDEQIIFTEDCTPSIVNPVNDIGPGSPACILFTSGSTGEPKGVILDQRAMLHRIMLYTNDYAIGPGDRLALLTSYIYNASIREIFASLSNGASLHLYRLKEEGVHHLGDWLNANQINGLYLVPSVFRAWIGQLDKEKFENLRFLRLGAEPVLSQDVENFQRHFGSTCVLANGYASTETGTICQEFFSRAPNLSGGLVPAGHVVDGKSITLIDENGCEAADGTDGEIVVSSLYLGPGYFTPDLFATITAQPNAAAIHRSVPTGDIGRRLPDGRILLLGRKDWQIKLHGQRVNLLEIERSIGDLAYVLYAAVVCKTGTEKSQILTAFVQLKPDAVTDEQQIRQDLRAQLPEFMLPQTIQILAQLPMTLGGKIDRLALTAIEQGPDPSQRATKIQTANLPDTEIELAVAAIWRSLLDIDTIGRDEHFFDLGGDSLRASALMAKIETHFACKLPFSALFEDDTIRGLAEKILTAQTSGEPESLFVTMQQAGTEPPIFFIAGIGGDLLALRTIAISLGQRHPVIGLKPLDYGSTPQAIATIEQAALRYQQAIQSAYPQDPYFLVGYSFGGHLAVEIGRLLQANGQQQVFVFLLDTYPPVPLRAPSWPKRFKYHFTSLLKVKSPLEAAYYVRVRFHRIYLRLIRNKFTRATAQSVHAPEQAPIAAAQIALATYEPRLYPGKVILFKATQREAHVDWDPLAAWKDIIQGQLDIRTIPGDHYSLLVQPQAQEIANQINQIIHAP
jgi:amino acid adenylation domain-containing protein